MPDSRIEQANKYLEEGKFLEAVDISKKLLGEREYIRDASIIGAKAFILGSESPSNKQYYETICKSVKLACDNATSIEDAQKIEAEIIKTYHEWQVKNIGDSLDEIVQDPSMNRFQQYFNTRGDYLIVELGLKAATRNNSVVDAYCESKGISKKQYAETCKAIPDFLNEEIKELEFTAMKRLYEKEKAIVEDEDCIHGSAIAVNAVARSAAEALIEVLVACSVKSSDTQKELERLYLRADLSRLLLDTVVYPDGKAKSLHSGDRSTAVDRLKGIYSEIKSLQPDFEIPTLPGVTPVNQQQSTGGCYVATAVYGTYDCPQVWTLRRYRDYTLAQSWFGRAFIYTYYAISPTLVKWFGSKQWFRNMWKSKLDRIVGYLNSEGVSDKPYNDKNW